MIMMPNIDVAILAQANVVTSKFSYRIIFPRPPDPRISYPEVYQNKLRKLGAKVSYATEVVGHTKGNDYHHSLGRFCVCSNRNLSGQQIPGLTAVNGGRGQTSPTVTCCGWCLDALPTHNARIQKIKQ